MPHETRIVRPGPNNRTVLTEDGKLEVPSDWALLPPGDAGLTRRVKAAWPTWTVKEKKGRRTFSRGVWAPAERIERIAEELAAERSTEQYARRRATQVKRREKQQEEYVEDFHDAILQFLKFDAAHGDLAGRLAKAVTEHATPVGSGTVARTQRIPISQRAESAVIAWMRHQTTAYDDMSIPSVRGQRREVRRKLAERSRRLLERYRDANAVIDQNCPLRRALE
ncbi:MAG: DUF2293 domain-containing protein [Planctomycetota bacterium]